MPQDRKPIKVSWKRSKKDRADGLAAILRAAHANGWIRPESLTVTPEKSRDLPDDLKELARDAQEMARAAGNAQEMAKRAGVPFDRENAPHLFRSALSELSPSSQPNDGVPQTADAEDK